MNDNVGPMKAPEVSVGEPAEVTQDRAERGSFTETVERAIERRRDSGSFNEGLERVARARAAEPNEDTKEATADAIVPNAEALRVSDLGAKEITDEIISSAWTRYLEAIEYECSRADGPGPWYLKNYVPAHVRVLAFRRDFPNGAFYTDVQPTKSGQFLGTARVYTEAEKVHEERFTNRETDAEGNAIETTYFRPKAGFVAMGRKIGKDVERAETGAISRALGFLGYGAVAAIAEGDDVRDERENRSAAQEHARHVAELNKREFDRRTKENARTKPSTPPVTATEPDELVDLRNRLIEFIGRKRIFSREEIEDVFGPIMGMSIDDIKDLGRKLKDIKTKAAWKKLAGKMQYADRWADYEGGTDLEQIKSYLFALVTVSNDTERAHTQAALDAANQLVPFDDVREEGSKIIAKLDEVLDDLDTLEAAAAERHAQETGASARPDDKGQGFGAGESYGNGE